LLCTIPERLVYYVYSASSLIQQSTGKYVAPFGNIILIPSEPVYSLTNSATMKEYYMLFSYQTWYIMWHSRLMIYIPWPIKNGQSRDTGNTLRITPPRRFSEDVMFLPSIDVMLTLRTINVICVPWKNSICYSAIRQGI
jgi:hypothetical protein